MKKVFKNCVVCGQTMEVHANRKYCDGCQKEETRRVSNLSSRNWQKLHPKRNREGNNLARRELYRTSPKFKITQNLRTNFNNWMDSFYCGGLKEKTAKKFFDLVGMTPADFMAEMKRKWQEKYGTQFHFNRQYIQLSHKVALATAETEDAIRALYHHSNLEYTVRRDNPKTGRPRES
ncbi:MAG: hypothetical protein VKL60_00350 [Sphaerospermopsis sp.]|nr:hypothetical protein [Sphaerospermopsis sp.]